MAGKTRARRKPLSHYLLVPYPFQVFTGEDPGYFITFPDLPGCMTQADSVKDIGAMAEDARRAWIEAEYERGNSIPEPSNTDSYSGRFNLRIPRSLHQRLDMASEREGVSLNQYILLLLAGGVEPRANPSIRAPRRASRRVGSS